MHTLVETYRKQIARFLRCRAEGLTLCQRWGKLLVMIIRGTHTQSSSLNGLQGLILHSCHVNKAAIHRNYDAGANRHAHKHTLYPGLIPLTTKSSVFFPFGCVGE